MANSKRWLDEGAPPEIRRLLRAATNEGPDPRAIEHALVALGTAGTIGTATSGALGATTKAASSGVSWVLAKWGAASVFGLGLATTTVATVRHYSLGVASSAHVASTQREVPRVSTGPSIRNPPSTLQAATASTSNTPASNATTPSAPRSNATTSNAIWVVTAQTGLPTSVDQKNTHVAAASAKAQPLDEDAHRADEAMVAARVVAPRNAETDPTVVAPTRPNGALNTDPQLLEEMRLIDQARTAMRQGRAADALRWLDEHRRTCSVPRLMPEALLLRMQALVRLGNRGVAREVAEAICADFPNSPHALRAREYLDASTETAP